MKKKRQKGFTLIELIVVIAILAIIAALAIPAFSGLKKNSSKQVCTANQSSFIRVILAKMSENGSIDAKQLDALAAEQGMTGKDGVYKGWCPEDGTYTVTIDNTAGSVEMRCSIHGGTGEGGFVSLKGSNSAAALLEAIKNLPEDFALTMTINSNACADVKSQAYALEQELNKLGFSTEGTTWRIQSSGGQPNTIYWTETTVGAANVAYNNNGTVAIKYDIKTGVYSVISANVTLQSDEHGSYYVITQKSGNYFAGIPNGTPNSTDFDAVYSYYKQTIEMHDGSYEALPKQT